MKKIHILLCAVAVISLGCGKKEAVQPSRDSMLATQAITVIDTIQKAFEEKNRDALRKNMGTLLAENTLQNLSFNKAELDLTARMVKMDNESVEVNITWHGLWWLDGADKIKNRGVADFVFHQKSMKLTEINGDNPFFIPKIK
jgi:hypothetical protein